MSTDRPYTIPAAAPLYPAPPYIYRDCPLLVVPFVAGPGVVRRLVPEPLEPNPDDIAYIAVGHLHNDKLGSTREAFVVVPSSDGAREGNFAVFLYLENDACVTSGREIWGWPKKLATIAYEDGEAGVSASVRRGAATLIESGLSDLRDASPADVPLSPVWFNHKIIPSVVEGAPPDVSQITATTFADVEVRDVRRGRPTLQLADTSDDPLASLLRVREVLDGHRMTLSFRLLHGEVVHDDLATAGMRDERTLVASR
jgi:acetoacetate decarboxylase